MKRFHDGRWKDSWQVPHRNRGRWRIRIWLKNGLNFGFDCGVSDRDTENILKNRAKEIIEANQWSRQAFRRWKPKDGQWMSAPAIGIDGKPIFINFVEKVTYEYLGADR